MHTSNRPEQIQVFFEIAMSIGSSLDLKEMVKTSLISYLRKLNCSSGAVLQLFHNEKKVLSYKSILSIPYKSKFSNEFKEAYSLIQNKANTDTLHELYSKLPITRKINNEGYLYIMNLPNFGLLCLKKNGSELSTDVVYTLHSLNEKFAQACIACLKNQYLITAKEKAEESDRLKTAFIENISHEIRTPLNAIMGYSSLIADEQISQKTLPVACKNIVNSSEALLKMIVGLLDVSLLEAGNIKPKYNLLNVNHLLAEQKSTFLKHVEIEQNNRLNLKITSPSNDFFIVSDEIKLNQIFDNLISNAVRFTDSGEIEIGYLSQKCMNSNKGPTNITFFIKDSGIGIPEEHVANIFKPFTRLEQSKSKIYRGAGIGLSITKKLIELLKGEIRVESKPGKGSIILFKIPTTKTVDELIVEL